MIQEVRTFLDWTPCVYYTMRQEYVIQVRKIRKDDVNKYPINLFLFKAFSWNDSVFGPAPWANMSHIHDDEDDNINRLFEVLPDGDNDSFQILKPIKDWANYLPDADRCAFISKYKEAIELKHTKYSGQPITLTEALLRAFVWDVGVGNRDHWKNIFISLYVNRLYYHDISNKSRQAKEWLPYLPEDFHKEFIRETDAMASFDIYTNGTTLLAFLGHNLNNCSDRWKEIRRILIRNPEHFMEEKEIHVQKRRRKKGKKGKKGKKVGIKAMPSMQLPPDEDHELLIDISSVGSKTAYQWRSYIPKDQRVKYVRLVRKYLKSHKQHISPLSPLGSLELIVHPDEWNETWKPIHDNLHKSINYYKEQ